MKKIIILCLMIMSMSMPLTVNATVVDFIAEAFLPVYHGDINDPSVCVVEKGDEIWVVRINGVLYVFYPNK